MKSVICALLLCVLCHTMRSQAEKSPMVNVYSQDRGLWGQKNVLICHVSNIAPPPEISLELLKNGQVIPETHQADLAFDGDWYYYLTKHVSFTPVKGERYTCKVTHKGKINFYEWEPDE
ncbi:beta-2-microglobulin-like [Notolabrus celidotus]|uniref:beta-2-microglobulin-like n=1 Tax=Notolabrus celidotus TaxID=1203425 RepID=UPI00148FC282|nr:beta-2-microglobulin-like [Notolabrus celidotus]